MNRLCESDSHSSSVDFSLDELVEFLPCDSFSSVSSNGVDDLDQLLVGVSVFELFVDISEVVEVEFSLGLNVEKGEVRLASLFGEGAALGGIKGTILVVSSLRNCSKSRGAPWVESWMSWSSLKTNSYLWSRPRVLAVMRRSLTSALL